MTAEGHFIFALASVIFAKKIAITSSLAQGDWWHVISGSSLTCLLPDIDHPKSFLGQRLNWFSVPISRLFGHRGFTHSLLCIILSVISISIVSEEIIPRDAFHAMVIGYLSHIVADTFTPIGVPILWPFRIRFRIPILRADKGKKIERLICIMALVSALQYPEGSLLLRYPKIPNTIEDILTYVKNNLSFYS